MNKKPILIGLFAGLILVTGAAYKVSYEPSKKTAEVESYEGVLIFTDSKPVKEYTYLGTVKIVGVLSSGQYEVVRNKLIKLAKKTYPGCEGIILELKDGGTDKADVFKFNN